MGRQAGIVNDFQSTPMKNYNVRKLDNGKNKIRSSIILVKYFKIIASEMLTPICCVAVIGVTHL